VIDEIRPEYVISYLDHIIGEFQIKDLVRALWNAEANFLVAIGCMNVIEFLGGIDNELLGRPGKVCERFKNGVRLLGGEYDNSPICDEDILYELRNGLTHQYLASLKNVRSISIANDPQTKKAIFRDGNSFTLNVAQLITDLGMAWAKLRTNTEADSIKLARLAVLLNSLPMLQ